MEHSTYFGDFLRDEVNLNSSRLAVLKKRVVSVDGFLGENFDPPYEKKENQGSYALETIIKPIRDNDEFDADILIYLEEQQAWEAEDYINEVHKIFKNNGTYTKLVHKKTRCVRLNYAGEFHLDMVPCIERRGGVYICNRETNDFEQSDGTGYREWLNAKNLVTNGKLKKVTRLLKYLRNHKKTFSAKSILLTTLIAQQVYEHDTAGEFASTPLALKVISNRLNQFLQDNITMPTISNPALPSENFNRHWDQDKYENFRNKFNSYNEKINDAYAEDNHNESVKKWRKIFGDKFGKLKPEQPSGGESFARDLTPSRTRVITPVRPWATIGSSSGQPIIVCMESPDLEYLKLHFPRLHYNGEENVIVGFLDFSASYDFERDKLIINPSINCEKILGNLIKDSYQIRIALSEFDDFGLPKVYEIGEKTCEIADKLNISNTKDLHVDNDGSCCLGIFSPSESAQYRNLPNFMELLINFFYVLSYREMNNSEPWCSYSHGEEGMAEYLRKFKGGENRKVSRNASCPCESGKKYKKCCLKFIESLDRKIRKLKQAKL